MNKLDFFLAAMAAGEFRRRAWVFSAFSLIREEPDAWKKNPYPYRIVQTPAGVLFVNPNNPQELESLEGVKVGEPPFAIKEHVVLTKGQVPNLVDHAQVETTYGNIFFNYTAVIWPFSKNMQAGTCKLPFLLGRVSASQIEELILPRLADDPKAGEEGNDPGDKIFVSEYKKCADAMFYLAGFTQLCVPGATEKSMVAAPGIHELRAKLLAENKDRLHDASVVAQIQKRLIDYDRAYLKGDPAENFLISKKSFEVVRSKQFGMHGAEMGLAEGVDVKVIPTSLSEGLDVDHWDTYNNSLRAGSFNRGAQTMLGGESVKWLLRASSNITVTQKDCGSAMGNEVVTKDPSWLIGFSVVTPKGAELVTKDNVGSYLGRKLVVRSPMYCKLDKTDYCATCVGERLAANPTALSAAVSEYGSAFLSIYMAAAHGKQLQVAKMDYLTAIQ